MTGQTIRIVRPVIVWALHFIALYALISAACAPRMLLDVGLMRISALVVTAATAILLLIWTVMAHRVRARSEDRARALASAAWWSALISLLAVVANLWPILALPTCTGL
jgi:hypothetical protein